MLKKVLKKSDKAAIYVRVSTEEQAKEGFSLAGQEQALKDHAKMLGYTVYKIYKDEGKSAKDMHRPAMQQMLKDAEKRYFSAIIVYKLDRFSRSLKDLILTIEKLKEIDVDFVSVQDRIETASASGKLMFHIISSFAEFERDIISERTRFGMAEKAKEGGVVSKAPLGYTIIEGKLVIDQVQAEKVSIIFDDYMNSGQSLNKIAKKHGLTVRGLLKVLQNRTYIGEIKFKESYDGQHESLIDRQVFDSVQAKLESESSNRAKKKYENILKGLTGDKGIIVKLSDSLMKKEFTLEERALLTGTLKDAITEMLRQEGFSEDEIFYNRVYVNADRPDISAVSEDHKVFVMLNSEEVYNVNHYLSNDIELWIIKDKVYVFKP